MFSKVLTLCLLTALPAAAQELQAKLATRQVAPVVALFTDDGEVRLRADPAHQRIPDEVWTGKDALAAFFGIHIAGLTVAFTDPSTASWHSDYFRSLGLEAVTMHVETETVGGHLLRLTLSADAPSADALAAAIPRANKAAVRHFFDEINAGNLAALDVTLAPTFVQHSSMPVGPGVAGVKALYAQLFAAFPDLRVTLDDLVAEGDRVVARMTWRMTQRGEYLGVAPSGKAAVLTKIDIFRFASGKTVEHWDVVDRLGLLQQLGAVPRYPQWTPSQGYNGFR